VYAPNSHGGSRANTERGSDLGWSLEAGELGRYAYKKHAEDDDFGQPGTLYREVMSDTDRENLVTNIVGYASDDVSEEMQLRVIDSASTRGPLSGSGSEALAPERP
jgi:catalase